ncbi:hypothetical protein ABEF95_010039 [Exophiala dermatitidis]
MDVSHCWAQTADQIHHPAAAASVSSYFTRPTRVVKSGSRNNSPRVRRRKTTTAGTVPSPAKSFVEHLRNSVQTQQWHPSERPLSRPVSWHPTPVEDNSIPSTAPVTGQDPCSWNFSTAQINGLVTPVSYAAFHEPQMEEYFTPLEQLPEPAMGFPYGSQPLGEQTWPSHYLPQTHHGSFSMLSQHAAVEPSWQCNQHPGPAQVQTAPNSPETLQMPSLDLGTLSLASTGDIEDDQELVGMGLYDSPAEVQSSTLFGGIPSGRKTLKLEESFEPTDLNGEDDDAGGEEDADGQEEEVFELDEPQNDTHDSLDKAEYPDQSSIASHLTYGLPSEVNPIAYKYLSTLSQLNSAYYPAASHGYGWI